MSERPIVSSTPDLPGNQPGRSGGAKHIVYRCTHVFDLEVTVLAKR